MSRWLLTISAALMAASLLAACGGRDDSTGISEVDAVVEAVLDRDTRALVSLLKYESVECTFEDSGGVPEPPRCQAGQSDGTAVEAIVGGACEGVYVAQSQAPSFLQQLVEGVKLRLYAVYGTESLPERPDYTLLFSVGGNARIDGVVFGVMSGGISSATTSCGPLADVAQSLEAEQADILVAR